VKKSEIVLFELTHDMQEKGKVLLLQNRDILQAMFEMRLNPKEGPGNILYRAFENKIP
jgi:hypothetical protein